MYTVIVIDIKTSMIMMIYVCFVIFAGVLQAHRGNINTGKEGKYLDWWPSAENVSSAIRYFLFPCYSTATVV